MLGEEYRAHAALSTLAVRHRLLRKLRSFFDERDFLEVTTPVLSAETVVDVHLEPFRLTAFSDPSQPGRGPTCYLQTSPEYHMKRLLASGATAVYQVSQVFRAGEVGPRHNPEFTMAEWYRCGDDMQQGIELLGELSRELLGCPPPEVLSYEAIFQRYAGLNPLVATDAELREAVQENSGGFPTGDRDDWLNWLFATKIEPYVGREAPVVVHSFPASQAALARLSAEDPRVAERFELIYQGMELANGYHELIDAEELLRRERQANRKRNALQRESLPSGPRFHAAMAAGIPPSTGVAMGFDRVVMLAAGVDPIGAAMAFPWDIA